MNKLPSGWQIKSLGEVASIITGYPFDSKLFDESEGCPLIRIRDIKRGKTSTYYKGEVLPDYVVRKGDYLIGMDGEFNLAVWKSEDALLNQRACKISFDEKLIHPVYGFYFLPRKLKEIEDSTAFVTVKHISHKQILNVSVPLPPLLIQRQIAEILERVDQAKHKRQEANKLTEQFLQSAFIEMFGDPVRNPKKWCKKKISDLLEVRGRVGWKGYKKTDLRLDGPLVLGATHLSSSGDIDLSRPVFISREKYEESPEIVVHINDLLIVQRGNTIGKVSLVNKCIGEATINPCILILRPQKINAIFLRQYLMHEKVLQQLWAMNFSSAQPMLTQKDIRLFEILTPPLSLQQQFAELVQKTEALKMKQKESEQELENLFNSLIQKAFKGELV